MKKLGERNYLLISQGVKMSGTFNPEEIFCIFEEELYCDEAKEIYKFLKWVHKKKKTFGRGNYEEIFSEFKENKI